MRMARSDWNSGWKYFDDTGRLSSNGREKRISCSFCKKEINCNQTKCRIHLARGCKGEVPAEIRDFFYEEMMQLISNGEDEDAGQDEESADSPSAAARRSERTSCWRPPPPGSSPVRPAKQPRITTVQVVKEDAAVADEERDHTYKRPVISFLNPETGERDETIEELVASVSQLKQELREVRRQNEAVRVKLQKLSKEQLIDIILTSIGE